MREIKLPFGGVAFHLGQDADEHERIIHARALFSLKYMQEKGWGDEVDKLTFDQIMEIREQEGWKNP